MTEELIAKLKQFLAEEVELLEDFAMDVEDSEDSDNRKQARALSLWTAQTIRVGAIRDAIELLNITDTK